MIHGFDTIAYDHSLAFFHISCSYKTKSKKDKVMGMIKGVIHTMDSTLQKHVDEDEFFEGQKSFIFHYLRMIKDAQVRGMFILNMAPG